MSPLLRALTYSRAAHDFVTNAMLLQAYVSLDAFWRGHGSRDLFTTLVRQLLIAEELCRLGHQQEAMANIKVAQRAMRRIEAAGNAEGLWLIGDADYAPLCLALEICAKQVITARLSDIAKAETQMLEGILRAEGKLATA
jgi:hypothetical protein